MFDSNTAYDDNVHMLLISAVSLKVKWKNAFDWQSTFYKAFTNADGSVTKVRMMKQAKLVHYYENDSVQVIELPFAEEKIGAVFFLPKNMTQFIQELTDEEMRKMIRGLKKRKVNVEVPKFALDVNVKVGEVLKEIGMGNAFWKEKADFGGITNHGKMNVDEVVHKVMVRVDEDGKVGAVSMGVSFGVLMFAENIKDFFVDKPFLFMVRDRDNEENMVYIAKVDKL